MHVAVTGGTGFIGSHVVRRLHAAGHTVAALVRATSRRDHIERFVARFVEGAHDDESAWPHLLDGADGLIHGSLHWAPMPDAGAYDTDAESNLQTSLRLLHASAPRRFVFISSLAVLHGVPAQPDGRVDEARAPRPVSSYGAYKAAVEAFLWAARLRDRRHTCAIRPTRVYGIDPHLERSVGFDILQRLARGEPVHMPGARSWVHVEDVAAAIVAAVDQPAAAGRAFNLADCEARWADLVRFGAEALGIEAEVEPTRAPQAAPVFSEAAARELGVAVDRGLAGLRAHMRDLATAMRRAGALP